MTIPRSVQEIGKYAIGFTFSDYQDPPLKISGFTITGYAGTAAETCAKANGFSFNTVQNTSGFDDVTQRDWFAGEVAYAVNKGLMDGTTPRNFSPNSAMTRGATVTAPYRLAGSPSVSGSSFSDVKPSDWYGPAAQWASQNNIVSGYGDGKFGPNNTLTRQQFAAILYRYAQYKHYDTTISGDLAQYSDRGAVNPLAIYGSLLEKYRAVVNKEREWDPDEFLGDPVFYNIYTTYYPKPGYAFLDVDQDGVPELLLGSASSVGISCNSEVYDLYSYRDGKVTKILEGWERNCYFLLENGQFRNEWSNGASDSGVDYYILEKGAIGLRATQGNPSAAERNIDFISF